MNFQISQGLYAYVSFLFVFHDFPEIQHLFMFYPSLIKAIVLNEVARNPLLLQLFGVVAISVLLPVANQGAHIRRRTTKKLFVIVLFRK